MGGGPGTDSSVACFAAAGSASGPEAVKDAVGDAVERETEVIRATVGEDVPLAGGFTHGEVGRVRGAKGDRNHALVVVAFG